MRIEWVLKLKRKYKSAKRLIPYDVPKAYPDKLKLAWKSQLFRSNPAFSALYGLSKILTYPKAYFFVFTQWKNKIVQLSEVNRREIHRLVFIDIIPIRYYFFFELHKKSNWELRHLYLFDSILLHCYGTTGNKAEREILNNKYAFNKFCMDNNLLAPELYGSTIGGKLILEKDLHGFIGQDFIIKPTIGSKGKGFSKMIYNKTENTYHSSSLDKSFSSDSFQLFIQRELKKGNFILQEHITNHPSIQKLSNGSLATVRIISFLDSNQELKILRPILQIPLGESITSHFNNDTLVYSINQESGKVAFCLKGKDRTNTIDLVIPFWNKIICAVLKAHRLLSSISLVGWDIAISSESFYLLEGNLKPSLDIHQRAPFTPLINTAFYEAFLSHLEKRN